MAQRDVLVIGKGPAALAAAAELAERGLRVAVVGPGGPVHWPAQYGAWTRELDRLGMRHLAGPEWPATRVAFGPDDARVLPHGYARIDRDRLLSDLLDRIGAAGVEWLDGAVIGLLPHPTGSTATLADGRELEAALVVDASGHASRLTRRRPGPPPAFQTAVGITVAADLAPFPADQALLMDWTPAGPPDGAPPSFLYAMRLPGGLLFLEETVLAARPAVPAETLERRLRERIRRLGVPEGPVLEREHCWIPMGGPLPDRRQRTIGFGGAGAMVHPATGYMLTRALAAAPGLAAAVAGTLGAPGASPANAARAAWEAVWPDGQVRRWLLFRYGIEVLLRLDRDRTADFFRAFFALPDAEWDGYLNDRLSPRQLTRTMGHLFAAEPGLRPSLARPMAGPAGTALARDLLATLRE